MKLHRIKPALTAIAALSLIMNLSAQRHGPAAAAEQAKLLIPHPELEATLFASEPMLLNPAHMDIDAGGRGGVGRCGRGAGGSRRPGYSPLRAL